MSSLNDQLMTAAAKGDADQVRALLLDPQCDARVKDAKGWTALMRATRHGHSPSVSLLLPVSEPLAKDNDDWTALMWAAVYGYGSCLELLVPVSDPLAKDKGVGWNALMWAAYMGHAACVNLLLPVSDAFAKSMDRQTSSEIAASNGHEALAILIDAYTLAQSEKQALNSWVAPCTAPKKASSRV